MRCQNFTIESVSFIWSLFLSVVRPSQVGAEEGGNECCRHHREYVYCQLDCVNNLKVVADFSDNFSRTLNF